MEYNVHIIWVAENEDIKKFIFKNKPKKLWIENHTYGKKGIEETIKLISEYRKSGINAHGMLDLFHLLANTSTSEMIDNWSKTIGDIEGYLGWFSGVHFPIGTRIDDSLPIDDMTDEMLEKARENARKGNYINVEFRKGDIENLPVDDNSIDAIISNCVINLSPDKPEVFREAFRALKPGGFIVVSDIVLNRELPPALKKHAGLYAACVAGALQRRDYLGAIKDAGFKGIKLLSDNTYRSEGGCSDPITNKAAKALDGAASSITVFAVKPGARKGAGHA